MIFSRKMGLFVVALIAVSWVSTTVGQDVQYNQASHENPAREVKLTEDIGGRRAGLLFWKKHDKRGDPQWLADHRQQMQKLQAEGERPMVSIFRWKQSFYRSKPGAGRQWSDEPAHVAWYRWLDNRRDLMMRKADGSKFSVSDSQGGKTVYGYINPNMPMPREDWPDSVEEGPFTNAMWEARRIGAFAEASGVRGVGLADGSDSIPGGNLRKRDFNPRIIEDFEKWAEVEIPGSSISKRAEAIKTDHAAKWLDYWGEAYAKYQDAIVSTIEARTDQKAFVQTQAPHTSPSEMRYRAYDSRLIMTHLKPYQMFQTVQVWLFKNRGWGAQRGALLGAYHARQPDLVRGAMMPMPSDVPVKYQEDHDGNHDQFFWSRTVGLGRELEADDFSKEELTDLGRKRLREMWAYMGWTHLANEKGELERAIEYVTGGGHQNVKIGDNLPKAVWKTFQKIQPAGPYGLAAYYSVPIEQTFEKEMNQYSATKQFADFGQNHLVPLYYVSDLTLDQLKPEAHPTGWLVPDAERLPEDERKRLEKIAPIYDPAKLDKTPEASPIAFSEDITGGAFVDQRGRVVLLVSRADHDKEPTEATIRLRGLAEDGTFEAKSVFEQGESHEVTIEEGEGELTVPLESWQTRVLITDLPSPAKGYD